MKRTIILLTFAALMLGTQPAAAGSNPAYVYTTDKRGDVPLGGVILTPYPFMPVVSQGVVSWYDYQTGKLEAAGLVHASGTLALDNPPRRFVASIYVHRKADNSLIKIYRLADTAAVVAPFDVLLVLDDSLYFVFYVYQENPDPNPLTVSAVFEGIP